MRRLVLLGCVLLSASLYAPPAHAAAAVSRFSASQTDVFPIDGYFCLPDRVGTATQTETSTGQVVETASGVFAFRGVDSYDIHIDFPDGSYAQSGLNRDLVSFVLNSPLTVFTAASQDLETIYNAQGQPVGNIEIHAISHLTYTDLNGNGQPDDGEVKAQVERFQLRCA
jgi:hypothetical protein